MADTRRGTRTQARAGLVMAGARMLAGALAGLLLTAGTAMAEAIPVQLQQTEQGWQLLRGGKPYLIRGAGGAGALVQLAAAGANSVRTWGADDIDALLDEAHGLGLTVTVGIWLGHERHGFDYDDQAQVAEQLAKARETVLRYKDHPALLIWGIGNEMEGFGEGDNPAIWRAVNAVAAMAKTVDPNHPTMSVTAEIGGARIEWLHQHSPAIDIHGINSYGGAPSLLRRYREAGGSKPFVLTEFGPPGAWEVGKTEWGAPFEPTSTEKAAYYRQTYEGAVIGAPGVALGSYAFTWGFKMEATATWFGMFLPDGARLGAIDAMTQAWSGQPPTNTAPIVQPLALKGPTKVKPGAKLLISSEVADPDGEQLRAHWALRHESGEHMTGGDFRPMLPDIEGALSKGDIEGVRLRMPKDPGPYRLFFYAYDEHGNAATANLPLLVKGKARTPLPMPVYLEGFEGMPWAPSGWMGGTDRMTVNGQHTDNPHQGQACIEIDYTGEFGWAGVAWQHPANDWGEQAGGFDLRGARALTLWARGKYGGEKVSFGVGLLDDDKPYPDSDKKVREGIVLSSEWKEYRISLRGMDLSRVKTGFVVSLVGRRSPVTVYLDHIQFVR